ncbi:unnamed protein product [Dibothriocephalus latus]|uniref:PDZ domain-containing protein n=1 Tax=Dibothriocephalus latus TaxID=60516 RepID=A0A3P6U2K5_DIBLA|nr:unnamed protein product [Dibothriocephalus latus]
MLEVSANGVIGGTKVTQLWTDLLPICVDITLPENTTYQRASKSEFAAEFHEACCDTIDVILEVARSLAEKSAMPAGGTDARLPPTRRPPLFVLTPAFMLYASAQTLPETADGTQATRAVISHMMFWLANASELLNFIRNDEDLLMHASNGTTKNSTSYRRDGPSVCDGVSLLERAIDFTFHELQRLLLECVEQLVPSILFPGDFDLQDDLRLDDRPRNFLWDAGPNPEAGVQRLLQALSYLMLSLRQAFQPFHRRVLELRALNSKRIEWLLAHLGDPPALPQEWVNSILKSAREELDGEQVYANRSSRGREILAVREDPELKLPLLIPPSGYAATSGLIGVPEGFMETIEPLVQDGYIRVRRNEAAYVAPVNGKWTGHLVVQDTQDHSKTVGFGSPLERGASQQSINVISRGPSIGNLKHEKLNLEKLAQRVGVKLSSIVEMVLKKGNTGLGLSIVAAKPEGNAPYGIYVRQVVVGGAAARDGRLETGDQILAVQNCPLIDCDQSEAVKMLAHNSTDQTGVHMVVAKRAAQARGILNLINAGEDHDRLDYDVSDEDDSDDSEDSGPRFGSRILPKGGSQPRRFKQQGAQSQQHPLLHFSKVSRHKSLEMLSSRPGAVYSGPQRAPRQESEPSTDDISEEGSDHVWRQEGSVESLLNPDHVDSAKRKTENLKKVGVELPVTKSQLQQFNMRRQQNNTDSERTDRMSSDSSTHQKQGQNGWQKPKPAGIAEVGKEEEEEEETSSPDWSDFARHNAEARSRVPNKAREKGDSPSPLDSAGGAGGVTPQPLRTKPAIAPKPMVRRSRQMQPNETEQKKKEDDVYSMPSDEAIYAPAEESSTTGSEDLLNSRQRIVSGGRTKETETPAAAAAAAEESQSVKTVSVSDKALQTTNE